MIDLEQMRAQYLAVETEPQMQEFVKTLEGFSSEEIFAMCAAWEYERQLDEARKIRDAFARQRAKPKPKFTVVKGD
jgi:hypothetical protein